MQWFNMVTELDAYSSPICTTMADPGNKDTEQQHLSNLILSKMLVRAKSHQAKGMKICQLLTCRYTSIWLLLLPSSMSLLDKRVRCPIFPILGGGLPSAGIVGC